MKALLLAAGLGTRLLPLTRTIPKCLVPIHGKPLMQYWLETLLPESVDEVLINTHYLPESVLDFIEKSPYKSQIKTVHEPELLGTGGTILKNREFFQNQDFFVAHADNLTRFSVEKMLASHRARYKTTEITMMTFETDRPETCGIVQLDDKNIVTGFFEKITNPPSNMANAAVYIFQPSVLDFLASLTAQQIDISIDVIPNYLGRIQTFHNHQYHRDIGSPESLALANLEFKI